MGDSLSQETVERMRASHLLIAALALTVVVYSAPVSEDALVETSAPAEDTVVPEDTIVPEISEVPPKKAAQGSKVMPGEANTPQDLKESAPQQEDKHTSVFVTRICSSLKTHWLSSKPVVAPLKAQFGTLAGECAKSTPHAGTVIMLADQLSYHVACRAHGRSTDGGCEDHMLGQLSDDESLHQELLQLPQIKKTDPAGLDCSSYKKGKLGTSDVKGFERNRFYKHGRHFELLAYCICQSKGQHFCASRSYEQLEQMAPSKPEAGLVSVKVAEAVKARNDGAEKSESCGKDDRRRKKKKKLKKGKQSWANQYELKDCESLEEAIAGAIDGYTDGESGGTCPTDPFAFIQKKEDGDKKNVTRRRKRR